eukprot:GABV01008532.1.p1 GENE.GABV01008532.1~~GABV01008532.1.p1  ORF type:complete len:901 (+),score=229.76 GABV01008532.1:549-3251(+)
MDEIKGVAKKWAWYDILCCLWLCSNRRKRNLADRQIYISSHGLQERHWALMAIVIALNVLKAVVFSVTVFFAIWLISTTEERDVLATYLDQRRAQTVVQDSHIVAMDAHSNTETVRQSTFFSTQEAYCLDVVNNVTEQVYAEMANATNYHNEQTEEVQAQIQELEDTITELQVELVSLQADSQASAATDAIARYNEDIEIMRLKRDDMEYWREEQQAQYEQRRQDYEDLRRSADQYTQSSANNALSALKRWGDQGSGYVETVDNSAGAFMDKVWDVVSWIGRMLGSWMADLACGSGFFLDPRPRCPGKPGYPDKKDDSDPYSLSNIFPTDPEQLGIQTYPNPPTVTDVNTLDVSSFEADPPEIEKPASPETPSADDVASTVASKASAFTVDDSGLLGDFKGPDVNISVDLSFIWEWIANYIGVFSLTISIDLLIWSWRAYKTWKYVFMLYTGFDAEHIVEDEETKPNMLFRALDKVCSSGLILQKIIRKIGDYINYWVPIILKTMCLLIFLVVLFASWSWVNQVWTAQFIDQVGYYAVITSPVAYTQYRNNFELLRSASELNQDIPSIHERSTLEYAYLSQNLVTHNQAELSKIRSVATRYCSLVRSEKLYRELLEICTADPSLPQCSSSDAETDASAEDPTLQFYPIDADRGHNNFSHSETPVSLLHVNSEDACLEACLAEEDCNWINYNSLLNSMSDIDNCVLLSELGDSSYAVGWDLREREPCNPVIYVEAGTNIAFEQCTLQPVYARLYTRFDRSQLESQTQDETTKYIDAMRSISRTTLTMLYIVVGIAVFLGLITVVLFKFLLIKADVIRINNWAKVFVMEAPMDALTDERRKLQRQATLASLQKQHDDYDASLEDVHDVGFWGAVQGKLKQRREQRRASQAGDSPAVEMATPE